MDAFECTGDWWLPDNIREKVAGTLKVSESGTVRLDVTGALRRDANPFKLAAPKLIYGMAEGLPSPLRTGPVTLRDCFCLGNSIGSVRRERYHANRAFFGRHLYLDSVFTSASLKLGALAEFCGNHRPAPELRVEHKTFTTATAPGVEMSVGMRSSTHSTMREMTVTQHVTMDFRFDQGLSADDINAQYVHPCQNLMTFVCDAAQAVELFNVGDGESSIVSVVGPRVMPHTESDEQRRTRRSDMLFGLNDIDFPEFIGNWLAALERHRDACSVFFAMQYGPPAFLDVTFSHIVQALYLYEAKREHGQAVITEDNSRLAKIAASLCAQDAEWLLARFNEMPSPSLFKCLSDLVHEHAYLIDPIVPQSDRFVWDVLNTLRFNLLRDDHMEAASRHGSELYWLMQRLRVLFKACLLTETGFTQQRIRDAFGGNAEYRHMMRHPNGERVASDDGS